MHDTDVVLAIREGEDANVVYAPPHVNVVVTDDGRVFSDKAFVEVYDLDRRDIQSMGVRTFLAILKSEVNVRRNADKRCGLIGG